MEISPDGRAIAIGDWSGAVSTLDVNSGRTLLRFRSRGLRSEVRDLAFSGDGRLLAAADEGSEVRVWETATGRLRTSISTEEPIRRWGLPVAAILVWAAATLWLRRGNPLLRQELPPVVFL